MSDDFTEHVHATSRGTHVKHSHGRDVADELRPLATELRRHIPSVYDGFRQMSHAAMGDAALPRRTKELIALAIAVSDHCDGCIAAHARGAASAGASEDEVAEALGVAIMMMGGPGTVYAPRAFAAFQEFSGASSPDSGAR